MKISIQSVNFSASADLLKYVEKKVALLSKFYDKIVSVEVFLKTQKTSEKENKVSEIKMHIPGNEFMVKKETKTFEEGVHLGVDSLKRQLRKAKNKLRSTEIL